MLRAAINLGNPVQAQGALADPPVRSPADVDRPGMRIGVEHGSANDLYLTRTLQHADIMRCGGTTECGRRGARGERLRVLLLRALRAG